MTIALDQRGSASGLSPRRVFLWFAGALTSALAIFVYVVPLNANDMLKHLFKFESWGLWGTFYRDAIQPLPYADWRPVQRVIGHMLYIALPGYEHLAFKGLLALSVVAVGALMMWLTAPRTWREAGAASLAILILFGHQSFAGAVEGVYPWGVDIVLVICQLAVLSFVLQERRRGDWWVVAISVFAILLNEKGGIVGATYIVAALVRLPGASRRLALWIFALYVAVLAIRFAIRDPFALAGRGGGSEQRLFDGIGAALNIILSDPRFGAFRTIPLAFAGEPWAIIAVASSALTTASIAIWAIGAREWRLPALLLVALLASAVFGAFSRKDYIPIMALPAYVLCAYEAFKWLLTTWPRAATALACVLLVAWGTRFAGLGYYLAGTAHAYQEEWRQAERYGEVHEHNPAVTEPIIARLRAVALAHTWRHPDEVLSPFATRLLRGRGCPELCK